MSYTNPETGRKIKEGSRAFKNLLKDYDFDPIEGFMPKNTNNKYYRDPSGFLISERMAQKWLKRSKNYKLENNEIKFVRGVTYNTMEQSYNQLSNYKSVKVELRDQTNKTYNFQSTNPSKKLSELFAVFYHDLENQDIISYTFYQQELDNDIFTIAHNSQTENCLMLLIKEEKLKRSKSLTTLQQNLYNELQEGVMPSDLPLISKTFKLNITIKTYKQTDKFINSKDNQNLTIYYDNFHVTKSKRKKEEEKEVITFHKKMKCNCAIENLSFDNTTTTCDCDPLLNLFNNTPNEDIHEVIKTDELLSFSTNDFIYKNESLNYGDAGTFILDRYEYNLGSIFRKQLFNKYIKGTKPRPVYNFEYEEELARAIMCNFQTLTQDTEYKEIDIKSAYDPTPNKEYPSNLDIRITTNTMLPNIGFYLITIQDPIYNKTLTQIYSTDELLIFNKHNYSYTIHNAFLSSSTFTISDEWLEMKSIEKRCFHHWLGYIQRKHSHGTFTTTDFELANRTGARPIRDGLFQVIKEEKNTSKSYMPHVAGYVMAHTRSKLIDYVLTHKVKPLRIWCDNIVVEKKTTLPLNESEKQIFKANIKKYKSDHEKIDLIPTSLLPLQLSSKSPRLLSTQTTNNIIYLNGAAGTGKTFTINDLIKYCDTHSFTYQLFSPTYNTAKLFDATVIQKFENNPQYIYKDIIIVDEVSMVTNKQLELLKFYSSSLIILSGDHENQLLSIEGDDINFDSIPTIKLTECKRCEDPAFNKKTLQVRKVADLYNLSIPKTFDVDYKNINQTIICATKKEVTQYNKSFLEQHNDVYITEEIKANMPVMVINNNLRKKSNGMLYNGITGYFTGESYYKGSKKYFRIVLEDGNKGDLSIRKIKQSVQLALAITYHKCQGQTINHNVILATEGLKYFCPDTRRRMLYVGMTRVKKESQLSFIPPTLRLC